MHLMVLGAPRFGFAFERTSAAESLNAPDGAGCSPITRQTDTSMPFLGVSMHLMVLGAP